MTGRRLLHVAFSDDWEACGRFGEYDVATRRTLVDDAGHVHATTASGLPAVLRGAYDDATEALVLVVVDEDALAAQGIPVRWEPDAAGTPSPRIGGALPMDRDTVVAVLEVGHGPEGWAAPDLAGLDVREAAPPLSPPVSPGGS
ncbi:DUF952 domain-containing protein [Krasilnikoviella flava]|uniref:Uncharacterized conserved protein, DUF952 family n=1 Tax=Krasilnikoviella flava TaxID=526729 RepID=A0A1T5LXU5_9MICO|nr:DUF952 domain-containing protein [Krasilnikoviella flava]SKC80787.1 Uncharacterized conserved protein, DUF952 family [Krasilnikoviella flava]